MANVSLANKKVLVTLPLTEVQQGEFRKLAEDAGATIAFTREAFVRDTDPAGASIILCSFPVRTLHGAP